MMEKENTVHYQLTVILDYQPEGVYTVTCKELPELLTEGETIDEALDNAVDAFIATLEIYEELGKELPKSIFVKNAKKVGSYVKSTTLSNTGAASYLWFNATCPPREVYANFS